MIPEESQQIYFSKYELAQLLITWHVTSITTRHLYQIWIGTALNSTTRHFYHFGLKHIYGFVCTWWRVRQMSNAWYKTWELFIFGTYIINIPIKRISNFVLQCWSYKLIRTIRSTWSTHHVILLYLFLLRYLLGLNSLLSVWKSIFAQDLSFVSPKSSGYWRISI